MSQPLAAEKPKRPGSDLKGFSCISCRQRKVRCDRRAPCLNCIKAEKQCNFIPPVRGKRKKTKPPRETLHARLKRYEEMLKSYGAKIEPCEDFDSYDSETESRDTPETSEVTILTAKDRSNPLESEDTKPKFIIKEGASRYFDRNTYRCDTLFILSGVAIRLARKMGLHRDGTFLGLPPFETEMRRRLWWHLAHVDFRTAEVMGSKPSPEISSGDAKKPLNVDDSELYPDMPNLPEERNGITAVSLCLIKCEIIASLCKCATTHPIDLRWEMLYSPEISLTKKDSIIDEVEDHLEKKYLRHCDALNPLHTFISVMIRSAICKMRLFAHNLRQFAHRYPKASEGDHDIAFANAMKLLEYANLIHGGHMGLDKYLWQLGTSYCWNTMLYLLIEIRYRKAGPEIDRAWQLIGVVFSRSAGADVLEEFTGSVYVAMGKWTLEVWDSHVASAKAEGLPEPVAPEYIHWIRDWQRAKMESEARAKDDKANARSANFYSTGFDKVSYGDYLDVGYSEPHGFPNLSSFDTDPNQWIQWEQLIAEQSGFGISG
ncbi:hypothetical protein ACHAQJ_007600 [Trichoderma viride]